MSQHESRKFIRLAGWLALFAACPLVAFAFAGHWNLAVVGGKELLLILASALSRS
jgi:hypothetical protein